MDVPQATFTVADTTTDDFRPIVRGADAVIHLSWLFQPTHRPEVTWKNNVLGAISVFEAAAAEKVPALIYSSSVAAYSPGSSTDRVTEDWPTHGWPGAAYPREKSYLERFLDTLELRAPEMRIVRMRPYFIFKRESATSQRRLFVGPLLPGNLLRSGLLPVMPLVEDLRARYYTRATWPTPSSVRPSGPSAARSTSPRNHPWTARSWQRCSPPGRSPYRVQHSARP